MVGSPVIGWHRKVVRQSRVIGHRGASFLEGSGRAASRVGASRSRGADLADHKPTPTTELLLATRAANVGGSWWAVAIADDAVCARPVDGPPDSGVLVRAGKRLDAAVVAGGRGEQVIVGLQSMDTLAGRRVQRR
jgi:hypothetical protein